MEPSFAEPQPARGRLPRLVSTTVKIALGLLLLFALFYYGSIDLGSLAGLMRSWCC